MIKYIVHLLITTLWKNQQLKIENPKLNLRICLSNIEKSMKYIVIGLGNFGGVLAVRLTEMGHEVIGADSMASRVDALKDKLSTAICLDASKADAMSVLPLQQADAVLVAIGDNFAASVQAVAQLRQANVKRIIARAISILHIGVLQTLGVERVIFVEKDSAEILAQSLSLGEFISSYRVDSNHYVVQFTAPDQIVGKTLIDTGLEDRFSMEVITIKRSHQVKNLLGLVHSERAVTGKPLPETEILKGDIIVAYGTLKDYDLFTRSLRK